MEMAIKSPAQGRRAVASSSPRGRLQREVHSIHRRCQETLRRAKTRKVEMELEEAKRRTDKEKYRVEIEEKTRLREEAKLKEQERKRKEEKKLRLEMKKDVEKMIKGIEEARKDFKKLFKPTIVPRVPISAVISADSASLPPPLPQNDQAAPVPVPVPVPVVIHSQGEKNETNIEKAPAVPVLSHQACAPVPVVSDSEGEKKGRENMKKLSNAPVRVNQNDQGRLGQQFSGR